VIEAVASITPRWDPAEASGTLADTDIDNPAQNLFTAVGTPVAITGGSGSYTMTSAGV